jgi:alkaline phosphatase D
MIAPMPSRRAFLPRWGAALLAPSLAGSCAATDPEQDEPFAPDPDFPRAPVSPPFGTGPARALAFTSCADQAKPMPLYDVVRRMRPDGLFMLGDNVYGMANRGDPALPGLRAAYARMAQAPEFQAVVREIPTLATWDDHDYGRNDGGKEFAGKAQAQRLFNGFWNVPPGDRLRREPGVHRGVTLGPARARTQVLLLDTRTFRDPPYLPPPDARGRLAYAPHAPGSTADILGPAQWEWLETELKKPADIRILCSSIQVLAEGHGLERWGNFPAVRERLFNLIAKTGAKGVVIVSGDRHHGAIHSWTAGVPYPLFDMTASSVNVPVGTGFVEERGPTMVERGHEPVNFGLVAIDWAARVASLRIIGLNGAPLQTLDLPFAALGHAT